MILDFKSIIYFNLTHGSLFGQGRNGLNAYVYGNYPFLVSTNAIRRLIVTGSGDVGINTLNPNFKLEVNGTVGFPVLSDGSSHTELVTRNDATGELGYADFDVENWENYWTENGALYELSGVAQTNSTTNAAGFRVNAGVGWATDVVRGSVNGNTQVSLTMDDFNNVVKLDSKSKPLNIKNNFSEGLWLVGDDRFGIATNNPSYNLDVNGTVRFSSISDGSSHTELVTRDSVTGELGYRDISDISPLSSDGTTLTTTDGSHRLNLDSPVAGISLINLSNNDDNYISMRATTNSSTEIRTLTDFIIKTNGNNERMRFKSDGGIVLQTETDNTSNTLYVKSSNGEISERSMVNIPLSSFDDTGYLTSEVDGSTTNELQTFEETLIQGSNITGNRTVSINTGYLYFNSGSAASQVSQSSVLNTSLNGSLDFADIETNSAEIILRHRLQGDGSDQDYMYLKAAGLDLAHRNNISLNSDSLSINAPTLTLDQNTTLQSGGFSLTNEMTGSSFYRINTSDAVVNIQPNYIDQTVDGLSGDTRILQGFGGIDISRNTTGDTGYPDFIFMDNDTLSLNHTEQINIDAPIIEINGEKMRTGGPQQVAISGTSGSINLGSLRSQVVQIDMTSASTASPISITITNPISNGTYTFHWQNTDSGGHDLDLPANMLNAAGTAFDGSTTITYDADDWFTCYYDGTNFYCK